MALPLLHGPALLHSPHLALLVLLRPAEDPGHVLALDVHHIVAGLLGHLGTRGHHLAESLAPLQNKNITSVSEAHLLKYPVSQASSLIRGKIPCLAWLCIVFDTNDILTVCWVGSHLLLVTGTSTVLSWVSHLLLTTSSQLVPFTSMHTLVGSAFSSVTVLLTQLSLGTFLHTVSVTLLTWETSTQEHFSTG